MSSMIDDAGAMRLAIDASRQALARGDRPFGAALVAADGHLLHVAANNQVTTADCTGHAEMVLVREAQAELGPQSLAGTTVFASGEPCAMCSGAMFWAGVRRVVYAASQADLAAALGAPLLPPTCREVLGRAEPPVTVDGPLLRDEAVAVLRAGCD